MPVTGYFGRGVDKRCGNRIIFRATTQRPFETATTALLVRSIFRLWSVDVPSHDRITRFPRNNAGFAMESQSRRACCISIVWELVGPAHVNGRDWMRFDSDRTVVWEAVGRPAGDRHPLHQHHWRSGECSHRTRLSATDWGADRRSDAFLPGPLQDPPPDSLNAARLRSHAAGRFSRA